jgi:signal peptidase I
MLPTLQSSDYVYVDKLFKKNLERGNLVVLDFQEDRKVIRLIGLAGDKVEIRNGYAYVNNEPLYEPYATTPITYKFDPVIVPEDHVFLLNDYRVNENDSRKLGSTPIENILGKALFCFWPVHQIKLL